MALIKDEAVVLRRLDFSESSQVLAVFTRAHGQQRVIAKGVKRATRQRASVGIDLLERGDIVFSQRPGGEERLSPLTEWRQLDHYPHLRADLARYYAGLYAGEAVAMLTEAHDPHVGLFDGLRKYLADLSSDEPGLLLARFLWLLLTEIGLQPELSVCTSCRRSVTEDRVLYFSSRSGGAICRDCEPASIEKFQLSVGATKITRGGPTDARGVRAALTMLDYHITEILGRPLRAARSMHAMVVKSVSGGG